MCVLNIGLSLSLSSTEFHLRWVPSHNNRITLNDTRPTSFRDQLRWTICMPLAATTKTGNKDGSPVGHRKSDAAGHGIGNQCQWWMVDRIGWDEARWGEATIGRLALIGSKKPHTRSDHQDMRIQASGRQGIVLVLRRVSISARIRGGPQLFALLMSVKPHNALTNAQVVESPWKWLENIEKPCGICMPHTVLHVSLQVCVCVCVCVGGCACVCVCVCVCVGFGFGQAWKLQKPQ